MADQRKVGHAIRRRMGAPSSHLAMAEQGAWHPPGPQPGMVGTPTSYPGGDTGGRLKGVPDAYETGSDTYGRGESPLAGDNAAFRSGVSAGVSSEPHPPRTRLSAGESAGARLTVSPSMKMPEQSPVPTQGGGKIVPSTPSRQGSFAAGQSEQMMG